MTVIFVIKLEVCKFQ